LIYRPKLCAYLFGNGTLDDALAIMGGFDSAMDEPVMLMPGLTKALMDQQLDRFPRESVGIYGWIALQTRIDVESPEKNREVHHLY
jgi:hypothetical protein